MKNKWVRHSAAISLINLMGKPLEKLGIRPSLEEAALIKAAKRATGISDFTDHSFIVPLRKQLADMENQAQLTTFGRLFMRQRMIDSLATRLQVDDYLKRNPEIMAQPLNDIWFIGALPRTGTTLLQRLLTVDPEARPILMWETIYPVPPTVKHGQKDKRIHKVKWMEKALRLFTPKIFAIHPIAHDAPEEDLIIMQHSFLCQAAEGAMHVPNYARWLETADKTDAYLFLEKVLKILQWQQPEKRWVLKNPFHMEDFDTLRKVFPKAKIIQTHRNMLEVMPSVCSLSAHSRGIVSDQVDGLDVGQHWQRKYRHMINKSMTARKQIPEEDCIDILYTDLMEDPIAAVENIYQHFNATLSQDARNNMLTHCQENKQNKYGVHHYSLEEFGLNAEKINTDFADYIRYYQL